MGSCDQTRNPVPNKPEGEVWTHCYENEACNNYERENSIRQECASRGMVYTGNYHNCEEHGFLTSYSGRCEPMCASDKCFFQSPDIDPLDFSKSGNELVDRGTHFAENPCKYIDCQKSTENVIKGLLPENGKSSAINEMLTNICSDRLECRRIYHNMISNIPMEIKMSVFGILVLIIAQIITNIMVLRRTVNA